ncbi:hypothetical protein JXA40_04225 [bacterium]|nr:hypothetical protein [candidate division CSSED10-310 bacterium]
MENVWQEFKGEQVVVFGAGLAQTQDGCKLWRYNYDLTYIVLADTNRVAFNPFSQGYIPHNAIMDENMVVQYTRYGYYESQIRTKLTELSAPLVKIDFDPLSNTENTASPYSISCDIRTGGSIISGTEFVYWNTDGGSGFTANPLTWQTGDNYTGSIPAQGHGTTVYYYLHAEADNGFQGNDPPGAPEELHTFTVLQDSQPPVIEHDVLTVWREILWGPEISADITDDLPLDTVKVTTMINSGTPVDLDMTQGTDGAWIAVLTGTVMVGDVVSYRIAATDTAGSPNTAYHPASGYHEITVIDMLDAIVIDLDQNHNSGPALQTALQNLDLHVDYFTGIPKYPELYGSLWICLGTAPDNTQLGFDPCMKFYEYTLEGGYVYLEGGNAWANDQRYPFQLQFSIGSEGSGSADTGTIVGTAGTFASGMSFEYAGDNNNMDRLKVKAGAFEFLRNADPSYVNGIARETATFRTIGTSFEFGGLQDGSGTSTKDNLAREYALFFDLIGTEPTPTPPPEPTPTPPPTDELGVKLWMPGTEFRPGSPCACKVTIGNPGPGTYAGVPLFVILDVYGNYFFWPSFGVFDYQEITVDIGSREFEVLPEFLWPSGVGSATGIRWYAAMTDPAITGLLGTMDTWEFGWAE